MSEVVFGMQTGKQADRLERVSPALYFQISISGCISKRKRPLSLAGSDTLNTLFKTIAGMKGGPSLYPKAFQEALEAGCVPVMMTTNHAVPIEADSDSWYLCAPWTQLSALQDTCSERRLPLLLRLYLESEIADPMRGFFRLDAYSSTRELKARRKWFKQYPEIQLKASFLHVTEQTEDTIGCSRSDPGSWDDDDMAAMDEALKHHKAMRNQWNQVLEPSAIGEGSASENASCDGFGRIAFCGEGSSAASATTRSEFAQEGFVSGGSPTVSSTASSIDFAQKGSASPGSPTASSTISIDFAQAGSDSTDNVLTNSSNINSFHATEYFASQPQLPASPSVSEWQTANSNQCSGTYIFDQRFIAPGSIVASQMPFEHACIYAPIQTERIALPGTTSEHRAHPLCCNNSRMEHPRAEHFHLGSDSYTSYTTTASAEDLFNAVTEGNLENIRHVIANMRDINEPTTFGSHILSRAVMKADNVEILRLLLDAGADVHASDVRGNSVMHFWARATGSMERLLPIGNMLLAAGADVNAQRSMDGVTPLHHVIGAQAKRKGQICFQKARFLLDNGADTGARLDGTGERPIDLLSTSSQSESTRRVRCLLESADKSFRRCS
eukprot:TRINITY_DN20174_c0_g3_i1.p1 TRINITY_DN20174_c0_g3~~TRINITY_DN20174_c0_g3_i1.p1  ORF type:complete len:612 (-),score=83.41 TRINITY_DN20174_c0_g3_i1:106-1941(-)